MQNTRNDELLTQVSHIDKFEELKGLYYHFYNALELTDIEDAHVLIVKINLIMFEAIEGETRTGRFSENENFNYIQDMTTFSLHLQKTFLDISQEYYN